MSTTNLAPLVPGSLPDSGVDRAGVRDDVTRRLYFRGLGLVCLIAFVSLWSQIHGLVGQRGLLPADEFFGLVHKKLGANAYWQLPSLCWFGAGNGMLHLWCALGTVLSILLMIGWGPRLVIPAIWATYLSLSSAGQVFLSFQWDTLLLEMLACSVLYAPRGWRPDWRQPSKPLPLARWLLWGLAFKLMFLSGVTKLLSGDTAWSDGTALQFHYYTQPIPSWTSWYVYQLPRPVHQISLMILFLVELFLPFLVFCGSRGRSIFGMATILLMVAIEATGNFGFFNLQTIMLAIPLLNDDLLCRLIPRRWRHSEHLVIGNIREAAQDDVQTAVRTQRVPAAWCWRSILGTLAAGMMLAVSLLTMVREMVRTQRADKMPAVVTQTLRTLDGLLLSWSETRILKPLAPLRTINGYGLFRVMTTRRSEIVIEISQDGTTWQAVAFPYQPGPVDRPPPIVAPHMPRLDWQMWFAGLDPVGNGHWLTALTQKLLEGNPKVARLIGHPEMADNPPRFVRLAYYDYKFTSADHRLAVGSWWSRSQTGYLTGPLSRQSE
ncbi:MAG: lipase maturation factor family protein [Planctomycetes bacterium]|nr:lipase maturation factor family protein [Planctomycetota bacterium]